MLVRVWETEARRQAFGAVQCNTEAAAQPAGRLEVPRSAAQPAAAHLGAHRFYLPHALVAGHPRQLRGDGILALDCVEV